MLRREAVERSLELFEAALVEQNKAHQFQIMPFRLQEFDDCLQGDVRRVA